MGQGRHLVNVELHDVSLCISSHCGEGIAKAVWTVKRFGGTLTISHGHEHTRKTTDGLPAYARDKNVRDAAEVSFALCRGARGAFTGVKQVAISAELEDDGWEHIGIRRRHVKHAQVGEHASLGRVDG